MSVPAFEIRNLRVLLGGKTILKELSFSLEEGESLCIIGPNGAGKSTLLKAMLRLLPIHGGRIFFEGQDIQKLSRRDLARQLAYVPQAGNMLIPYTVYAFVLMARYPYQNLLAPLSDKDHVIVHQSLEQCEMEHFAERPLASLSGGERQKVFIAAALAQCPRVLFLDEATTFLDYRHEGEVLALIRKLRDEEGVAVVSVTHDLNQGLHEYERVLALKDGRRIFFGPPQELMNCEMLTSIYDSPFRLLSDPEGGKEVVIPGKVTQ
ncbi:MAG: ABC transporter ATP-binding protein [Candidatus Hydrogenedens sp.]|jgi:iron complex transport system ATP-binding protein|nr:ABC transporter ATP-binding protein [Candidatus Hydrogenedens sp.]